MKFVNFFKAVLKIKTETHSPSLAFALYCLNNPSASACKIYDL